MKTIFVYILVSIAGLEGTKLNNDVGTFSTLEECRGFVIVNAKKLFTSAKTSFPNAKITQMGCVDVETNNFKPIFKMKNVKNKGIKWKI